MGVLEAGTGQPKVVKPMIEPVAGDGDAQYGHIGEIRQTHPARLMDLAEDDLLVSAMQRPPGSDAAFQGAPDSFGQIDVAALHLFEDRDRAKVWRGRQHRDDLGVEEISERIRAAAGSYLLFM